MNEQECLSKMIAPGQIRPLKPYRGGVIQIWVTRACNLACYGCTQGSNLSGNPGMITVEQFEKAVLSLSGYFGVVGVFGGNPALHPKFDQLCEIMKNHVPYEQRGIWCNHPKGHGKIMQQTFNPAVSNLNVHLDKEAYREFMRDWPEAGVVGLVQDSRHSPPYVALKDVVSDEDERWELISRCDINQRWSAMIGVFRGELRAWFCEVAGAQSMLHQHEEDYPDTGIDPTIEYEFAPLKSSMKHEVTPSTRSETTMGKWWQLTMSSFANQVHKHCHDCGIPLRGYGELAQKSDHKGTEQVSQTHKAIYNPKHGQRRVELVLAREQLHEGRIEKATDYLGNARR